MSESLGSIKYNVDIDTGVMLKAENAVGKSTSAMERDFNSLDKKSRQAATQMTKSAEGVKKAVHRNYGQAGIQVQQFVGQIQGGQSAMLALSQQSADLGIVLGAPMIGVIVSLASVLVGYLLPSLMSNKTSADALAKAIENVKAVMTLSDDGVVEYTENMEKLNSVSKQLAKVELAKAIIEQNKAIKLSAKSVIESAQNTSKLYESTFSNMRGLAEKVAVDIGGSMDDVAEAVSGRSLNIGQAGSYLTKDLDLMSKKFKITRSEALELGLAFSDVSKKGDAVSLKSLQNVIEDLSSKYGYSNEKLTELSSGLVDFLVTASTAVDGANKLKEAIFGTGEQIEDVTGKAAKATSAFESMQAQLEIQNKKLGEGERAAFKYSLQLQNLKESQIDELMVLYDKNKTLEENKQKMDEATAANQRYEQSVHKKTESDLAWFEQQEQWLRGQDKQKTATLTTQVQSIGLTPEEEIQARYDKELELLKQAEERKIQIEGTYAERRNQIELERQEALRGMQSETNEFMTAAFGNLETQIAGTMAQVVVGAKDGREAMAALANTILTQVIGAVVQWGIAEVTKLFTVESAEKGIQAANAAATTASVSAQVGMNTALAAQNAFMSTAAIPVIGPALAPAAAVAAGAASASIGATAIPLAPLAGARQYGGPVSQGMYRVNETGTPEIYSQGNKDYLMNTKNANITPLDKAGGGSQAPQIVVNNNSPERAYVTHDEVANITRVQIGKESKKASQGRGVMYQGLSKGTNVRNNARKG